MDDNINDIMLPFSDSETKFHYLNYCFFFFFKKKAVHGAIDANLGEDEEQLYVYKLECLYEWWEFEQYKILNN